MSTFPERILSFTVAVAKRARSHKGLLAILAVFVVFQLYFVRELLAAELLFGIGFAVLLVLGGIFYLVGALGVRALNATDVVARILAHSARRGYSKIEEVSKKPFRHPGSESVR
jgi:hypothetical protein